LVPATDLTLELKWDEGTGLAAKLDPPEERKLMRWIMNMRPLLDPESEVRIDHVWGHVKNKFADKIPDDRIRAVDEMLAKFANRSPLGFKHNEKDVSAAAAYELVATRALWAADTDTIQFRPSSSKSLALGSFTSTSSTTASSSRSESLPRSSDT
jgi:hypothetical protein